MFNPVRILLFLLLLLATRTTIATEKNIVECTTAEIEEFVATGDTNHLKSALSKINENFHLFKDQHYLYLFNQATRQAILNYEWLTQDFYTLAGLWHKQNNNLELAADNLVKAYEYLESKGQSGQTVWLLVDLGNIFYQYGDFDEAGNYYRKALGIAMEQEEHYALSVIYMNLGLIQHKLNNPQTEVDLLKKSAYHRLLNKDQVFVSHTYAKLTEAYLEQNMTDSASRYLSLAESIYKSETRQFGFLHEMPAILPLMKYRFLMATRQPEEAKPYLDSARSYLQRFNLTDSYLSTFLLEAEMKLNIGQHQEAAKLLLDILSDLKGNTIRDKEKQTLLLLVKASRMAGDKDKALEYFDVVTALEEHSDLTLNKSRLHQVRSMLDLLEKETALRMADQALQHQKEKEKLLAGERDVILVFSILALALSTVLLILLKRIRKEKKQVLMLNQEIQEQNRLISENSMELEQANQVKDRLFGIIGHDLRGPMYSLLTMTGIVKAELDKRSFPDLDNHLRLMRNTLMESTDLFERLLQWSKLNKKQLPFHPVILDVDQVILNVIRLYEPMLEQKSLTIHFDPGALFAKADENLTHTVLRNLIGNAINALPQGREIRIWVTRDEEELTIGVSDTGYGFSKEVLNKFRDNTDPSPGAVNGLGLAMSREMALLNGGRIEIGNRLTGGAEVRFFLKAVVFETSNLVAEKVKL